MSTRSRGLAITLAAASLVSASPAAARAEEYPTAFMYRTDQLTDNPWPSMPTAMKSQGIDLNEGWYWWTEDIDGTQYQRRSIFLATGHYTWRCALDPELGYYTLSCSLTQLGGGTAYLPAQAVELDNHGAALAWYQWGGSLDPQF